MALAYQYAELNKIPHRFSAETKMAGRHIGLEILHFVKTYLCESQKSAAWKGNGI